jgi:hypothetical protein
MDHETRKNSHTFDFNVVLMEELTRIRDIRAQKKKHYPSLQSDARLAGLALSGGGIRSAAFNLGVLQAFANADRLHRFDYLSTVSGGGYIGSALTWFLTDRWLYSEKKGRRFGTGKDDHPLGRKLAGAKTSTSNNRIDHIRGFGNYLRPSRELWTGSAAALLLQNMTFVTLMWFFPLMLLMLDRVTWIFPAAVYSHEAALGKNLGWLWIMVVLVLFAGAVPQFHRLPTTWKAFFDWRDWPGLPTTWKAFFDRRDWPGMARPSESDNAWPSERNDYPSRLARQHSLGLWIVLVFGFTLIAVLPVLMDENALAGPHRSGRRWSWRRGGYALNRFGIYRFAAASQGGGTPSRGGRIRGRAALTRRGAARMACRFTAREV